MQTLQCPKPVKLLLLLALFTLANLRCTKEEISSEERNLNTTSYFEEAIRWNGQYEQWEFFNWIGTNGPNGVSIPINVHDYPPPYPVTSYSPGLYENAITRAVQTWEGAFERIGISANIQVRYERQGDPLFTSFPRLDIYYEYEADAGKARGQLGAIVDGQQRKLKQVHMHIAQTIIRNGERKVMTEEDYLATVAHEMGHALGIYRFGGGNGHSPDKNDVMYSPSRYHTLSNGDVETLWEVYSRAPFYRAY